MTPDTNLDQKQKALRWFIDKIRMRMMDRAELNELLGDIEMSNEEILSAVESTIADWNDQPPPLAPHTIWDFPDQEALILGSMAKLLLSGSILHFRNQLAYSAGGISVNTHDKGNPYKMLHDTLYSMFKQRCDEKKVSMNIQAMLKRRPGIGSDYGLLHWYGNNLTRYL